MQEFVFVSTILGWIFISLWLLINLNWRHPVLSILAILFIVGTTVSTVETYKYLTGQAHPLPLPQNFRLLWYMIDEVKEPYTIWLWILPEGEYQPQSYVVPFDEEFAEFMQERQDRLADRQPINFMQNPDDSMSPNTLLYDFIETDISLPPKK